MVFDSELNFKSNLGLVSKPPFYHLKPLSKVCLFISHRIHSFTSSTFDSYNALLSGLPTNVTNQLQLIQETTHCTCTWVPILVVSFPNIYSIFIHFPMLFLFADVLTISFIISHLLDLSSFNLILSWSEALWAAIQMNKTCRRCLTYDDRVIRDLLCVAPVVVKCQMPNSCVQVLDEAGLVHIHRACVPSSRLLLVCNSWVCISCVRIAERSFVFGNEPTTIQQLHKVILGDTNADKANITLPLFYSKNNQCWKSTLSWRDVKNNKVTEPFKTHLDQFQNFSWFNAQ